MHGAQRHQCEYMCTRMYTEHTKHVNTTAAGAFHQCKKYIISYTSRLIVHCVHDADGLLYSRANIAEQHALVFTCQMEIRLTCVAAAVMY